ncbi:MAG: rod shape-determining protein RodA [Ardenticatenales bacterium]|nr:rod shape-determining protein RodA [Ardenticatenales bacterium]
MLRRHIRNYDYTLLFLTLALVGFGLLMIHSSAPPDPRNDFFGQQLMWALLGIVMMMLFTVTDYRFLGAWARPLYIGIVVVLGMVFLLGETVFGAQRWFQILDRQIQPSEFAKVLVIISLAKFLSDHEGEKGAILLSGLMAAVPMGLILLQPNLSTTIVLGTIWLVIAIMGGMPLRWLMMLALLLAIAVPLAWPHVPEYQKDRVLIFMDPTQDPSGQGYNLIQSRIAIGGGGLIGQGYGKGTQNQLGYLRVRHTDFIFSVIAEELGFVGSLLLFTLLIAMIFRLIYDIGVAQDAFGRLLIAGVAGWVFFQSFVNIGVNLGLVPPTGVPLPFISYGGSNLINLLLAIGLVQSVVIRQKKLDFD